MLRHSSVLLVILSVASVSKSFVPRVYSGGDDGPLNKKIFDGEKATCHTVYDWFYFTIEASYKTATIVVKRNPSPPHFEIQRGKDSKFLNS